MSFSFDKTPNFQFKFILDIESFTNVFPFTYSTHVFGTYAGEKIVSFFGNRRATLKLFQVKRGYKLIDVLKVSVPVSVQMDVASIDYNDEDCNVLK